MDGVTVGAEAVTFVERAISGGSLSMRLGLRNAPMTGAGVPKPLGRPTLIYRALEL